MLIPPVPALMLTPGSPIEPSLVPTDTGELGRLDGNPVGRPDAPVGSGAEPLPPRPGRLGDVGTAEDRLDGRPVGSDGNPDDPLLGSPGRPGAFGRLPRQLVQGSGPRTSLLA